jgi:C4-dicarboxylate transporter DctM subunit
MGAFGLDNFTIGLIGVGLLIGMVVLGVRVYIAAAIAGFVGMMMLRNFDVAAAMSGTIPHSKTVTYPLSVLPLFILIGFLAFYAGLTGKLFEAARRWVGWVPGGLAVSTVFATAGFAAVSGASTATAAVFSRVAIPDMLKNGYDKKLAAGVVAAGGTLASLIPPSAILVIYAIIVEESVGKLLLAGFLPGLVSALIYAALIIIMCIWNPKLGRPIGGFTWQQRFESLPGTLPIFLVIGIIFGAIYTGTATPTEAGALGAMVVFSIYVWRAVMDGEVNKMGGRLWDALIETAKLTAMIFTLIWGVLIFRPFPRLRRAAGCVLGLGYQPRHAADHDHDLHPARVCDPWHVHGRDRDADPDAAGRVPGGDRAWLRSHLVRHHCRQDGRDLPHYPAHWIELFRGRGGHPRFEGAGW